MMSQAQSHHDALRSQEDPICTMFYYPQKVPNKPEHEGRYCQYWASLVAQLVKNVPAMQETPVQFLGREDAVEKG